MKDLKQLIRYAKSKGLKVSFVGQKVLHDYAGMNPEAGKALDWKIKRNEIEIDKNLSETRKAQDLRHELIEMNLMRSGQGYEEAHLTALKLEKQSITPKEIDALSKIGSYSVSHIHDDGDLTIKSKGRDFVVTTEGQVFLGIQRPQVLDIPLKYVAKKAKARRQKRQIRRAIMVK